MAGVMVWDHYETKARNFPATVTVKARPGTAIVVPFRRRIADSGIEALGVIDGNHLLDPDPLPQQITALHSGLYFMGRSVSGHLLLWVRNGASLSISHPGEEFDPFSVLQRR